MTRVTALIADVERHRRTLTKLTGRQLDSASIKATLRGVVETYYDDTKQYLPADSADVASLDAAMQSLLSLCHKRGLVSSYIDLLKQIKRYLVKLDGHLLSAPSSGPNSRLQADALIIQTLQNLLPSAALSYEQALIDLEAEQRLSWRGPAADLREALRETLDRLAPDEEVIAAPGYKNEPETRGPTMKQKVRYILKNRETSKAISAPTEDAVNGVDESMGSFVRSVYTRSSVSTHTPTDKREVMRVADMVRVVLSELLNIR